MIRIMINWDFVSPILQTVSGIVEVHYVPNVTDKWELLAKFRTKCEPGTIGYSSLDDKGVSTILLDGIKPQLDIMVRSYQQGVIMDKSDFVWVIPKELDEARYALSKIPASINEHDRTFEMKKTDLKEL